MAMHSVDPLGEKAIHISFDIDALDSLEVPSTGTAGNCLFIAHFIKHLKWHPIRSHASVRGGLTLRESIYIVEQLRQTGRLEAIDMVEVNPAIGSEQDVKKTVAAAIHILVAACGTLRGGNLPKIETSIPSPILSKA